MTYVERLGPGKLPPANLKTAGHTKIQLLELRPASVTGLRLSVGASTRLQAAHLPRAVITPSAEDVGRRITDIRLGEAGDKVLCGLAVALDRLFEQIRGNAFVVTGDVRVVTQHRGRVYGEPRQDADILQVRGPLKPQKGERLVGAVLVLRSLGREVGQVRIQTAV